MYTLQCGSDMTVIKAYLRMIPISASKSFSHTEIKGSVTAGGGIMAWRCDLGQLPKLSELVRRKVAPTCSSLVRVNVGLFVQNTRQVIIQMYCDLIF